MLLAYSKGLTGTAEPATAAEELDVVSPGNSEEAGEVPHDVSRDHPGDASNLPSRNSWGGMFPKLILFGIIVGVIAIIIRSRKGSSATLTEKSLA